MRKIEHGAFHTTNAAGYKGILRHRAIIPLGLRASDETIRASCEEDIAHKRNTSWRGIPDRAIREIMEEYLATRPNLTHKAEVSTGNIHTSCLEIALGYGQGVLFSNVTIGGRHGLGSYTFLFDAEDLVRKGALLLLDETFSINLYRELDQIPDFSFESEGLIDRMKALARKIHDESESREWKSRDDDRFIGWYFFPGIVPLEWAVAYGPAEKIESDYFQARREG